MDAFPIFLKLAGRRALVVGGTAAAARKVELLLEAGAGVTVIARHVEGGIAELLADRRIAWGGAAFADRDLDGQALVIVATGDGALDARVAEAAERRDTPVNVVDCPHLSTFIMPSIVDRAPITIAISTGGTAPSLARLLRAEIDRALPMTVGRLARFAETFRDQVRRTLASPRARRLFWDRVFEGRIGELALAGEETAARRELIRLLDTARTTAEPVDGMIHHVDASAGDPELLTLRDHRLLQSADVIVHDRDVPASVLALARRDAARVAAPADVNALARSGKTVVRVVSVNLTRDTPAAGFSL